MSDSKDIYKIKKNLFQITFVPSNFVFIKESKSNQHNRMIYEVLCDTEDWSQIQLCLYRNILQYFQTGKSVEIVLIFCNITFITVFLIWWLSMLVHISTAFKM